MKEAVGSFVINLLKISAVFILTTLGWGLCTLKFYSWFVLPVFSLPEINLSQAVGLSVFLILFNKTMPKELKEEYYKESKNTHLVISVVAPYLVLGLGWLIKLFL